MSDELLNETQVVDDEMPLIEVDHLVTEDDTPVDNLFSEKQMRILADSLYASWQGPGEERPFVAMTNVGLFYTPHEEAIVPDVLVSLDVKLPDDLWEKPHRSYFIWEYGKPPNLVIEIVSNKKGREKGFKLKQYARLGIGYYIIFDPAHQLSQKILQIYELRGSRYEEINETWLTEMGLGVKLWYGVYQGIEDTWLRWCDQGNNLLLTGSERAEQEYNRAERLAAQLRALGIEPEA